MIKTKKQSMIVVGAFILVLMLFTTTYAFFNYTRTGSANTIRTGRISFNHTQGAAINLTDMFPIDVTNGIPNDATKVGAVTINVTGDTTYTEGLEYLVSAVNVTNTVGSGQNAKTLPISIDITVEDNDNNDPTTTLGTPNPDYFETAVNGGRGGNTSYYKVLAGDTVEDDGQLLVGYIAPGSDGVDGNIVIKAYIDSAKVGISDTYPAEVTDTNNDGYIDGTPASFGENRTVFTTTEWNSLQTNGVSFKIKVESNEGIWVEGPQGAYGDIKKMADTTTVINFANNSSDENGKGLYRLYGTDNDQYPIYYYRGAVNNNNVIFGDFCWQIVRTTDTGGIKMIYNGTITGNGKTCENANSADRMLQSKAKYSSTYTSLDDVGYMKNHRVITYPNWVSGALFASDATWTGEYYELTDASVTTPDATHHYSCNSTDANATCTSVIYIYNLGGFGGTTKYHIILSNGETINDAIYKMTGNGDAETIARNDAYVINQDDSPIKTAIESWFEENLTNIVDNTKMNYVDYLEDTIWCNDRSIVNKAGWDPNNGSLGSNLTFGSRRRWNVGWFSTTNVPSFTCPNVTDRFSVSSSVAHLNYPVGLLTVDEIVLSGEAGIGASNQTYYLYIGDEYWSMSPNNFGVDAEIIHVDSDGRANVSMADRSYGVRPVISLKLGTEFESGGDGTPTNPYVVKYN